MRMRVRVGGVCGLHRRRVRNVSGCGSTTTAQAAEPQVLSAALRRRPICQLGPPGILKQRHAGRRFAGFRSSGGARRQDVQEVVQNRSAANGRGTEHRTLAEQGHFHAVHRNIRVFIVLPKNKNKV